MSLMVDWWTFHSYPIKICLCQSTSDLVMSCTQYRTPNDMYILKLTCGKVVNICAMLTLICLINLSAVCVVYCVAPLAPLLIYSGYTIKLYIDRIHSRHLCSSVCSLLCGVVPVAMFISAVYVIMVVHINCAQKNLQQMLLTL